MSILDFNPIEFEEALELGKSNIESTGESMEDHMTLSLNSLLFLGRNIKDNPELLEVAIFNIRLCYTYYKKVEDYLKLAEIVNFVNDIEPKADKLVDSNIINDICINLN
jgi:hypothetical protein